MERNKNGQFISGHKDISNNIGRLYSAQQNERQSNSMMGKKATEETKIRMSLSAKRSGVGKWMKGRHLSEETKRKISLNSARFFLGKKLSEETCKKISISKKGSISWNKGKKCPQLMGKGRPHSFETRRKIGLAGKGRVVSVETRKKISDSQKKVIHTKERNKKISIAKKGRKYKPMSEERRRKLRENSKSPINKLIRKSQEYEVWRNSVFQRDNYTCQKYKNRGEVLHPHHILNFSKHPELRFSIDNGITLSASAHREFHKKYGTRNNTQKQIDGFLDKTQK